MLPKFFVDSDNKKQGTFKWDIEIISPDEIKKRCQNPIVLISSANAWTCKNIAGQLKKMSIAECHMLDEVIWGRHKEELMVVYDMLESDSSKELFVHIILSRIKGNEISEEYVTDNEYFALKDFRLMNAKEVFVDCGAYVGDTVENYLYVKAGVFGEIYAFEPDIGNFDAMSKRVRRLKEEWNIPDNKLHIIDGALGREEGRLFINNDIGGLDAKVTADDSGNGVEVYRIDSYFADIPIGFLKADIEGCEFELLNGAAASIHKYKPLLAICVYHQAADLYKIPTLIMNLNQEYKIDIEHHYYNYTGTVLYAY